MEKEKPADVSNDVLHIPPQTKLTPEEVAKAVAHHNRHHQNDHRTEQSKTPPKAAQGKKIR